MADVAMCTAIPVVSWEKMKFICLVLLGAICCIRGEHPCEQPLSKLRSRLGSPYLIESAMVNMSDGLSDLLFFRTVQIKLHVSAVLQTSGVRLHTNIFSKGEKTKRYPVVIDRSPYGQCM